MAEGGCVNGGDLVTTSYSTPVPWIGLYIATATLVCLIFMTRDFLHGLIRRKPFLPCKWFQMNALTLTLLQVATKIPVDLTASMPRAEDQLSKLTGTVLLCTAIGFYMPSLGTMGTSERYSNMVALSMMVITVIVNVCIQLRTGPIFTFTIEHIIIIVCMLVLLLLMWSSALSSTTQIQISKNWYTAESGIDTSNVNAVRRLEELLQVVHVLNYTGNPQSLLCETWHHNAFGLLCLLSFIVVLQATLRSVVFKTMRFCSGVDDYQWSIPFVIVTQLLTIGVGTCSIIYRWFSFFRHTHVNDLYQQNWFDDYVGAELENLKLKTLSFRVFGKNISVVLQVPKDLIIELLIRIQIMLYGCSKWFIGLPLYRVKRFFGFIIAFFYSGRQHDIEELELMSRIVSIFNSYIFNDWIFKMAVKQYKRWKKKYDERWTSQKNENPIIHFISNGGHIHVSKSECFVLGRILQHLSMDYEYKVSCLTVMVLSRMLIKLMPSSSLMPPSSSTRWTEFLRRSSKAFDESFDIIYYVDHNTLRDDEGFSVLRVGRTQIRLSLIKLVWANWKNPKHWFYEIISDACTLPNNSENSENSENYSDHLHHHARKVLEQARQWSMDKYRDTNAFKKERRLIREQKQLIVMEISLLCEFILKSIQNVESIENLFDFLEMSFVKILRLTLSALPKAILKEIQGDYPYGICEGNVREAFKFFYALKSMENIIEWSWGDEVLSEIEENEVTYFLGYPNYGAERGLNDNGTSSAGCSSISGL